MVENASPKVRRGRPRKFEHDQVVADAMGAFFAKGFDATTLTDLEVATGVDRSSLYNSFGGKSGLYRAATTQYLDAAANSLFKVLHDGTSDGIGDTVAFLEQLRFGLTSQAVSPGCLIINDMAAGSDPDAARRYRELLDAGLRSALGRAADAGDLETAEVEHKASVLSSTVIGINLISGHTGDNAQVEQLVTAAIAEVTSWRSLDHLVSDTE